MKTIDGIVEKRVYEKLAELKNLRPISPELLGKLRSELQLEMTYNSNGIEGNSLTQKETFLVINEGITIKGKPLKDHLEAKDQQKAIDYLYGLISKNSKMDVTENLIKSFHKIVMFGSEEEISGVYRKGSISISGSDLIPPDGFEVPSKMNDLIIWFRKNKNNLGVIKLAALFHHKLLMIHPFVDGNGRTARLLLNYILMKNGFPLVVILKNDRKKYYRVLSNADKMNNDPLIKFTAQAAERSLNIYLRAITKSEAKKNILMKLSVLSTKTNLSSKYLNLLVRSGKLEAVKQGRLWYSTIESVNRYLDARERKR